MKCSLIIRCHNEQRHIGRLLSGVLQQTERDYEIIVVDSGSTDGTLEVVSSFPAKIVTISPEQFSFGRALNLGCDAASGDFLVLASAHVYPLCDDWLTQLLTPFSDPSVALVYGKQRGDGRSKYSEHRVFAKWFPDESHAHQTHPFCNNANAAVRRTVWQQLLYDETLTGLEDLDWAKRAMALGHRIAYAADATIVHVHEETPRRIYNRYRREAIALKRIMPEQRFSAWDLLRLLTSNVLTDWHHAFRDGLLRRTFTEILVFRLMQFLGTYRGFSGTAPVTMELKQRFYYPDGLRGKRAQPQVAPGRLIDYEASHVQR